MKNIFALFVGLSAALQTVSAVNSHQRFHHIVRRQSNAPNPAPVVVPNATDLAPDTMTSDDGCAGYHQAQVNETIYTILDAQCHWSLKDFLYANPSLLDDGQVVVGKFYCTTPPANLYSGAWTPRRGCKKYHTVQSGETCQTIAAAIGDVSVGNLRHWNAHVDCNALLVGHAYCTCDGSKARSRSRASAAIATITQTATVNAQPDAAVPTITSTVTAEAAQSTATEACDDSDDSTDDSTDDDSTDDDYDGVSASDETDDEECDEGDYDTSNQSTGDDDCDDENDS